MHVLHARCGGPIEGGKEESPNGLVDQMKNSSMSSVWNAIYVALFGAPEERLEPDEVPALENLQQQDASPLKEASTLNHLELGESAGKQFERPTSPEVLFVPEKDIEESAPDDFFLFIKDYGWSLRYSVSRLAKSVLDVEKPLQLEWVKLRKPVSDPKDLLEASRQDLFDWEVREPPSNNGFMYQVTRVVGSSVEAVINFFEGRGLNFLIHPDVGVQLAGQSRSTEKQTNSEGQQEEDSRAQNESRSITHCWVQVMGMPWLPILQSIAFFNLDEEVMKWQA